MWYNVGVSRIATSFRARYYAGETAEVSVEAAGASAVRAVVGPSEVALSDAGGGLWSASVPTAPLVGRVTWTVFVTGADGTVSVPEGGRGSFAVLCAGRSARRDVVDAIDRAVETWGTNPNRTVSVGEVSISYKSLDELLAVRARYVQMAEAEETGRASSGGVRAVEVRF